MTTRHGIALTNSAAIQTAGEKTVVLAVNGTQELDALTVKAQALSLATYTVSYDSGKCCAIIMEVLAGLRLSDPYRLLMLAGQKSLQGR